MLHLEPRRRHNQVRVQMHRRVVLFRHRLPPGSPNHPRRDCSPGLEPNAVLREGVNVPRRDARLTTAEGDEPSERERRICV